MRSCVVALARPTKHSALTSTRFDGHGGLDGERSQLLRLLSRFRLSPDEAKRCSIAASVQTPRPTNRDAEILRNPYVIAEEISEDGESPIASHARSWPAPGRFNCRQLPATRAVARRIAE